MREVLAEGEAKERKGKARILNDVGKSKSAVSAIPSPFFCGPLPQLPVPLRFLRGPVHIGGPGLGMKRPAVNNKEGFNCSR